MLAYAFHPLARMELDDAVEHYESVSPGKGRELLQQLRASINQIREYPESAPISRGSVRTIIVQPGTRWSYSVHYRIKQDLIRILAVSHHKQQPFYWFGRR